MNLFDVIKSVLAAIIGVQSEKNRKKDFSEGRASHFIIVGILVVAAFVISLLLLVKLVLNFA